MGIGRLMKLGRVTPLMSRRLPTSIYLRHFAGDSNYLDRATITNRVIAVVIDADKVDAESHFEKDLGLDSLDAVELVMHCEEEFLIEIPNEEADKIMSVPDAVNYISTHPNAS